MSDDTKQIESGQLITLILVLNAKTGELSLTGPMLADQNLALRTLIEAAHSVINQKAKPVEPQIQIQK